MGRTSPLGRLPQTGVGVLHSAPGAPRPLTLPLNVTTTRSSPVTPFTLSTVTKKSMALRWWQ